MPPSGGIMWGIRAWQCECGTHVKVMYEGSDVTTVRCPKPDCETKQIVPGKLTGFWFESDKHEWMRLDAIPLVVAE